MDSANGSKFEIAEIKQVTREVGFFGGIFRSIVEVERISPSGTETIARSDVVEWRVSDRRHGAVELDRKIRAIHQKALQGLLADGWEPMGTDPHGRVVTLRRPVRQSATRGPDSFRLDRDAGWCRLDGRWVRLANTGALHTGETGSQRLNRELQTQPLPGPC